MAYNSYDCQALEEEYVRLARKSHSINKQQDDIASNDSVATGVGLIIFWPALFFIDNDDVREQVAQLKGELDAVEQVSIKKKCHVLTKTIDHAKSPSE